MINNIAPKKSANKFSAAISAIKQKVKDEANINSIDVAKFPDIIDFVYNKKYLDLASDGFKFTDMQKIILTCFYRKQRGNEKIKLSKEEIRILQEHKLDDVIEKYNSNVIFNQLVLILGRRCLGEKMLLCDPSTGEIKTIGELYDSQQKNINVTSLDESNYNFCTCDSEIFYNGIKNTYRVTLTDGRYIEATDNHPFLTIDGWKEIKELSIKDRIAVPKELSLVLEDSITEEEATLIGYMTGDGCCTTSSLYFTCSRNEILEDFSSKLKKISDNVEIVKHLTSGAESKEYQFRIKKIRPSKKKQKNDLALLLQNNGLLGCRASNKFVPRCVFMSSNKLISSYLKALFSCDGSLYLKWCGRDKKYKPSISYCSISEELIFGVQHLLTRLGIPGRLRKKNVKSNFNSIGYAFEISIDRAEYVKDFLTKVGFVGRTDQISEVQKMLDSDACDYDNGYYQSIPKEIWKYVDFKKSEHGISTDRELIGEESYGLRRVRRCYSPSREKIKNINIRLKDTFLDNVVNDSILWMPIKSIEFSGKQRTFDVAVDGENKHNFVANGIITHNSGKDLVCSILALYEIMKLLEIPGGDPFSYYGIAKGNPIYILTVANSQDQAKILYTDIKEKLQRSPYFRDKIGFIEADRIYLLTPSDKHFNQQMEEDGLSDAKTKGSVVIMCGHSNSEGLLGKRIYALLLDEVASFKKSTVDAGDMYSRLGPSTADFRSPTQVDQNGEHILDSKIISISSPRGQEGILWYLYKTSKETPTRLVFKLPTWEVRPKLTRDMLRREYSFMNEGEFMMEFGAEFSGTAGEKFIPDHYVDEAVEIGVQVKAHQRLFGYKGVAYYAHLDPAVSSHNYALVILHVEDRIRSLEKENGTFVKEKYKFFVVDHIKVWTPGLQDSININEVDDYIIQLSKHFRFVSVSYDSFDSYSSMQKLRKAGIPTKRTPFRRSYTITIFDMLEHLLVNHQIALQCKGPHAELLQLELKGLKRKYGPNGYRIGPDPEGTIKSDDAAESLAGAIGVASDAAYQGYVRSGTVYMPQAQSMGRSWNIGGSTLIDEQIATLRKFGKM